MTAMLFRRISLPYLRRHVLRTLLTMAGIGLGVAVFVAMQAANDTVLLGFSQTVDRIAGKTQLQVTAGEAGFGEEALEKVEAGEAVAAAAPVIEAVTSPDIADAGNLLVIGVDMTGDRSLRDYQLEASDDAVMNDPLIFLAQPDSIILSKTFAARYHLGIGSRLPLRTVEGQKALTVRGIMTPSGLASAFGGNLAVMDIYAAQKMFGRGRTFDRIDVGVKEGTTVADVQRDLSARLGPGFEVQAPSSRGRQFEAMLSGYAVTISLASTFALFIGMFIIYSSFSIAVSQRRFEIGMLRALGATRRQVRRLFLLESAALGTIGSIAGVFLGVLVARAMAGWLGGFVTDLFRVSERADQLALRPTLLIVALLVGVAASLIAAAIPADRAARVDPVSAFKKAEPGEMASTVSFVRLITTGIVAVAALFLLFVPSSRPVFYAGYACAVIAAVLVAPAACNLVLRTLRPLLRSLWPVEGALGADSLIKSPRRTSAAVTALMLSLALVIAFGGIGRANYQSIVEWTDTALNPDLFVIPTPNLDVRSTRFPSTMEPEIAAVPGVGRVQTLRNARVTFHGTPTMVVAFDMASMSKTVKVRPVAGDPVDMYRKAAAGQGLLISDNFAQLRGVRLGDVLEIPGPYDVARLPVVGIVVDYSDQQGSILLDRSMFTRLWHDDSVNMFRVYVSPGASIEAVRQAIVGRYAGQRQVFVLTNADLRDYIFRVVNQWFGLTSGQIAIAVLVAILGIVNMLTVSVIDRRREFALLQAVGGRNQQVRRTIWIEALTVAAVGIALGCAFGAINLFYLLDVVRHDLAGLRLEYVFPFRTVVLTAPVVLLAAFVAALLPAESAVRGSIVEALEYE